MKDTMNNRRTEAVICGRALTSGLGTQMREATEGFSKSVSDTEVARLVAVLLDEEDTLPSGKASRKRLAAIGAAIDAAVDAATAPGGELADALAKWTAARLAVTGEWTAGIVLRDLPAPQDCNVTDMPGRSGLGE